MAVASAGGDWLVMVAGKGHESFQLVAGRRSAFSDRKELEDAIHESRCFTTGVSPINTLEESCG